MKRKAQSERQTSQSEGCSDRERDRNREGGGMWSGHQGNHLDIEPPLPLLAKWNQKSTLSCPILSQCLISGTARSLLATGLSVTRHVSLYHPKHALLQRLFVWFRFACFICCCFVFLKLSFLLLLLSHFLFPFAIDVPVTVSSASSTSRSGNFFSAVVCILIRPKAARTVTGSTGNTFVCHLNVSDCVCTFVCPGLSYLSRNMTTDNVQL